ncbi:HNH endonuclease [Xanthomonas oryzae pv. oryzae]|uniref:HNH endonuclease n=1 Tax=Xanthomonas oryzae TaxID=347 RepID=UPI0005CEC985|nr:HNH endonuclease [Xanthomonas oryzae]AJQ88067.1 hypothetical protein BE73_14180 [Xanthomonas oryzae pv. oryzicola]AVU02488.1 HNH endonuclease [Xanthomonas oryzae pv. oryzae]QBI15687.1 HNH endonuclease [Xanthomonas oryzae pv. oryzae]QBN38978.1 HNH endonuclease [Xanthomonas oryzae pv. oryzae]QBN42653.1 HNH endonuclease [Xanthomonas oryzae pv. oryzae]
MPHAPGVTLKPLVELGKSPDQCWKWLGRVTDEGRAVKQFNGNPMPAQRWIWQQLFGPIKLGFVVYSTCGDHACCNPHHLRCGFMADANRSGNSAVLLAEDVAQLRKDRENGLDDRLIAEKYGISVSYVRQVAKGRSWGRKKLRQVAA